ncbi:MAG: mucoidy inhibitor MuiA family protein [Pseudomonadota bacterium]
MGERTLTATSRIEAVTVYTRTAEVTRTASVTLEAGATRIRFRDLPQSIVPRSLRVTATSDGDLTLGAVETRTITLTTDESGQLAAQRRQLERQRDVTRNRIERLGYDIQVKETQRDYLVNLAGLPARTPGPVAGGMAQTPDWAGLFGLIGDRMSEVQATLYKLRQQVARLDKRAADIEKQLGRLVPRPRQATLGSVLVTADAAQTATITVRYQVRGASWRPTYDARLVTADGERKPELRLVRRAIIRQSTSEPWNKVRLTLSTARVNGRTAAPDVRTMTVAIRPKLLQPRIVGTMRRSATAESAAPQDRMVKRPSGGRARAMAPRAARQQQAQIATDAFQARFEISGTTDVVNDGREKRVFITSDVLTPELVVRTVPRIDPRAFLSAAVTLPDGVPTLAGNVALFRNATFVGRGQIPQRPGGAKLTLGFGADAMIRVKVDTTDDTRGATGLISTSSTDTKAFRFTLTNAHPFAVRYTLVDRVPVAADDKISVDAVSGTSPSRRDVDGERGVMAWDGRLEAKGTTEIKFGYRLTWPDGEDLAYRTR